MSFGRRSLESISKFTTLRVDLGSFLNQQLYNLIMPFVRRSLESIPKDSTLRVDLGSFFQQ